MKYNRNYLSTLVTDDVFRLKAFNDYCQSSVDDYQKVIEIITAGIDAIPEKEYDDITPSDYSSITTELLSSFDIRDDLPILLNDGYTTIRQLMESILAQTDRDINDISDEEVLINLTDAAGQINNNSINVDNAISQIKDNLYSAVSLCAANSAMMYSNVADRIQVFNDKVNSIFKNAYSTISSTATYLRSLITQGTSTIKQYFGSINTLLGIGELSLDNSTTTPSDTDITKFTGSSPASALAVTGVWKSIGSVLNAGLKIIGGVIKASISILTNACAMLYKKVRDVAVDPYDVYNIEDADKSYTFANWSFNTNSEHDSESVHQLLQATGLTTDIFNDIVQEGRFIKLSNIFGETIFKINSMEDNSLGGYTRYSYYKKFKPRAIDPLLVFEALSEIVPPQEVGTSGIQQITATLTLNQAITFLNRLKNYGSIYLDTNDVESRMLIGLQYAHVLYNWVSRISSLASNDLNDEIDGDTLVDTIRLCDPVSWARVNNQVNGWVANNIEFVMQVSGWDPDISDFIPSEPSIDYRTDQTLVGGEPASGPVTVWARDMDSFLCSFILNAYSKVNNTFTPFFFPYRNGVEDLSFGTFGIKTDAENISVFNQFINNLGAVVLVSVISIMAIVAVKRLARRIYFRRLSRIKNLDRKMLNGQKLTRIEQYRYLRDQKKLAASKFAISGLQEDDSLFSSLYQSHTDDDNLNVTARIYSSIVG